MARNNELDPSIEGFDTEDVIYRRPTSRRVQPVPQQEPEPDPNPVGMHHGASSPRQDDRPNWLGRLVGTRTRSFLGIFLLLCCVFIVVAFVSHLKNAASYQAIVANASQQEVAEAGVNNSAGGFGAWLAQVFMCDSLGLGSLVFIVYAWMLGLALLGFKKIKFWALTFHTLLLAISISVVLGLVFYATPSVLKWGGLHGHFINKFLIDHTTVFGAILVSCLLIAAVCCVYLDQLRRLWNKWRQSVETRRMRAALEREREEKAKCLADIDEEAPVAIPAENTGMQPDAVRAQQEPPTIDLVEIFSIDEDPQP
ncbi:MAG: DNA translocase FtsK 4TM domain-containing protein, partial [Muribaculaceae bacterium]|nr:DNA translocase FtsK 4TM domain-containing protein [Muribaculaceae bacterium]